MAQEVFQDFVRFINTSSTKRQVHLLSEIQPLLLKKDAPEAAIKTILKVMLASEYLYFHASTRRLVTSILEATITHHSGLVLSALTHRLEAISKQYVPTEMPYRDKSARCLLGLKWSCIIMNQLASDGFQNKQAWQGLSVLQAILYDGAVSSAHKPIINSAYRKLVSVWKKMSMDLFELYYDSFKMSDKHLSECCGLLAAISKYNNTVFIKHKNKYWELYIESIIFSKTPPAFSSLTNCKLAMKHIDHDEFKSIFLPAFKKALLRSPENVILSINSILESVSIDLSSHATEIMKLLASQVTSKNDKCRDDSVTTITALSKQCSDSSAVEDVVKFIFTILKGAQGSLTLPGQKLAAVSCISAMAKCPIGSSQTTLDLTKVVADWIVSYFQHDMPESIAKELLQSLSLWGAKFKTEVPKNVVNWLKKTLEIKTLSYPVRTLLLECMIDLFNRDTIEQALVFVPALIKIFDKACAQHMQWHFVTEGLLCAIFLCKLVANNDQIKEIKDSALWPTLLDTKKKIFTSEKYFQNANDNSFTYLLKLVDCLFFDYEDVVQGEKTIPYCQVIVKCLLHQNYQVRISAAKLVKKLYSNDIGIAFQTMLINEYSNILQTSKIVNLEAIETTSEILKAYIPSKRFERALNVLISIPHLENKREIASNIAMLILNDCYHPHILNVNPGTWTDFLYRSTIDAEDFITAQSNAIKNKYISCNDHTESSLAAFADLTRIAPHQVMPLVVTELRKVFSDPELQITIDEYGILNTPPGQLYNVKAVLSVEKIAENKNIKRESKLYSHKDQLAAMEMEKELKAKKDKDNNDAQFKNLNKKQQQVLKQELETEEKIRNRLLHVQKVFIERYKMIKACLSQHYTDLLGRYIPSLIKLVLSLMQSPLTSKEAQEIFLLLGDVVIPEKLKTTGLQMAYAILRIMKPGHPVDKEWCEENLLSVIKRIIYSLDFYLKSETFSAPCFSYVFVLLSHILDAGGAIIESDEEILQNVIEITLQHAKLRYSKDGNIEYGPTLLPRCKMLEAMSKLIGVTTPTLQSLACDTFINTCQTMDTSIGDFKDYKDEIKIILNALKSPIFNLRLTSLNGLLSILKILPKAGSTLSSLGRDIWRRVWVAAQDVEAECKDVALKIWQGLNAKCDKEMCNELMVDIVYYEQIIQESAAVALFGALKKNPTYISTMLTKLIDMYQDKLYQPPPVLDNFGRVISEQVPDDFQARIGIALALGKLSPLLEEEQIETLFRFFVPYGLKDRHPEVRSKMLDAAVQALNDHGKKNKDYLLQIFEEFLRDAPTSESFDAVRQNIVILMGTLARHLDKTDPKIKPIAAKLTEALSTPSQQVQEAIAKCLPPLVPAIKDDAPAIVKKLLEILLESEKYGERKGAAYGLAGMVKGLGIIAFKQLDIMNTLTEAIQDKKNFRHKEGALFAFEMFCSMLGRLFEPYVVHVLPHLLLCFGDRNEYVREAADETARTVMANLSAHGVKLILPSLLSALKEDSWRTKTGSVELLGAMAFCAPKQLSSCLPSVVPRLCEVITDSHPKVQKAGQQALKQIGSVIRNPEIKVITPVLLSALSDPSRKTAKCLETLLNTKFVHFIDAASLALILPVVHRAFQDRSTDTRKMAAQIIRNMYSLTDQKDLNPYLPSMIPGLKNTLLDPVPEVRGIAAKALGSMVKGTGETLFKELLPWLMETITSEQSSVDRSGGAQGLAEVLHALGTEQLSKLMPDITRMAGSTEVMPHVRDGYIMMFIFLPNAFKEEFTPFIGDIIPIILKALADETEFLRETALCAGQRIITMYAEDAISLLLPELENGLFDENWRIRFSSIQLLGDLLFHISGVTGKMSATGAEDDNFGTNEGLKTIISVLGEERSYTVLSGLYMGRLDTALLVRQAALHVWKIVVPNTARILREILTTLFYLLISCLSASSYDKRQVAARTLGDVVRKLGERMLPEIIPILSKSLQTDDPDQRQGVCIGLSEIIKSCSKDAILTFTDSLVPSICCALCDELSEVRVAAASTFDNLHITIGIRALEDVLPKMLQDLNDPEKEANVMDGLRQIIAIKGRVVLPFIIPKLIQPPINTFVLAHMSAVAGEALSKHLNSILKALLSALEDVSGDKQGYETMLEDCKKIVLSVQGEHGARITIDFLLDSCRSPKSETRFVAVTLLTAFCKSTEEDYSDYVSMFIRAFFKLLADEEPNTQQQAWEALAAVTKRLDAAEMLQHVSSVRQAVRFIKDDLNEDGILPGFCWPKKGLSPIIPIFREGILNGSPDLKEQAAKGLGDCINVITAAALKPSVVSITGPLIRILGDRFSGSVRIAVLETLTILLQKAGIFLKPFLPQLQTTFSKALQDSNRSVRLHAAAALHNLVLIHPRLDPLFTDLNSNVKSAEDDAIRETTLYALRGCITGSGTKMGQAIKTEISETLVSLLGHSNETVSKGSAGCLGSLCRVLSDEELDELLEVHVFDDGGSWEDRQGRSSLFAVAVLEASNKMLTNKRKKRVLEKIKSFMASDRIPMVSNGIRAASFMLIHDHDSIPSPLTDAFCKGLQHNSNDVKIVTSEAISWVFHNLYKIEDVNISSKFVTKLISELLSVTKEKNTTVKSSAEYALVDLLELRTSVSKMEMYNSSLNSRDATFLGELYKQKLKRLSTLPATVRNIDDTILTVK